MIIFVSIFSFIILLLGVLINVIPKLKARFYGYWDTPPLQDEINERVTSHKKCYILFALASYLSYSVPYYLNWHILAHFLFITTVIMGFNMVFYIQLKHYHPDYKNQFRTSIVVLFICWIVIITMFTCGVWPNKAQFTNHKLVLSGMYGLEIPLDEVTNIRLLSELPKITDRIDGFSLDYIHKGHYHLSNHESYTLLINAEDSSYIEIFLKNQKKILFNFRNTDTTKEVYQQLILKTSTAKK